jgi:ATP-dependent helicase HrpA
MMPDLPITASREAIVRAIRRHRVVIVSGETGSGKTTQIPKFCLEAGRGRDGWIGCTQPRRIAATSVAHRIAEEFGESLGRSVGYKIRFHDRTPPTAYVKVMTDGILLAEAQADPLLSRYDTLIVDEAHERSLNIDFVLGILKNILENREDFKLVITSATIDTEKFSKAFDGAPVIEVSGRLFPVEIRYRPLDADDNEEVTHVEAAVQAVVDLMADAPSGDLLVFMPTEQDIRETCEMLEARSVSPPMILPLYARLSADAQRRVFSKTGARKVIVATNVAETSITIPGIRYVVDTGLARIPRYSPRSRTTGLPVVPISRSSADQRSGRCGRVQDGVCIRLFSEEDYLGRPRFTPPEIVRSSLADVILRMIALGLGDIDAFPFIDPPDPKRIKDGLAILTELGAIGGNGRGGEQRLTRRGRLMARLPLDPRLSRMLIESCREGCLEEMAVIVSALSIQDPKERPSDATQAADQAHARFKDPESDFVTFLNIWNAYQEASRTGKTKGGLKGFCRRSFISFRRMREWLDIHRQIVQLLSDSDLGPKGPRPSAAADTHTERFGALYSAIHRSILSGFLSQIAQKKEKNLFRTSREREVMVFPGSALFNRAGDWIMAAEIVETSRLFARTVAHIDPKWIEPLAGDLCRRTFMDPHWERKRGTVMAREQVTLFGLLIEPGRPVVYGRIDPAGATEVFVRSALVDGDLRSPLPFMAHNRAVADGVADKEDRLRRRGIFAGEEALCDFYRRRLDAVWDIRTLNRLIRQRGDEFLRVTEDDLIQTVPDADELALYPDRVTLGPSTFAVDYRFEPGADADGVTVSIPAAAAKGVASRETEWLVPGLLREKLTLLIKGLPKPYRRRLVPVTNTVEILMREMPRAPEGLMVSLVEFVRRRFGIDIPAEAWSLDSLPEHLKMRFEVTGADGKVLLSGRDPVDLRQRALTGQPDPRPLAEKRALWEKEGLTDWTFGDLPESVALKMDDGVAWALFPGLSAHPGGASVDLRLFDSRERALAHHRAGVETLYRIRFAKEIRRLGRQVRLPLHVAAAIAYSGGAAGMVERIVTRSIQSLFRKDIRRAEDFEGHGREMIRDLVPAVNRWLELAVPVLEAVAETRTLLFNLGAANAANPLLSELLARLTGDLMALIPEHFVMLYGPDRMPHLPRYAKAIGIRARRAVDQPVKDRAKAEEIAPLQQALSRFLEGLDEGASQGKKDTIEDLFWGIEEYKVSVFAQELGTSGPVSLKRLRGLIRDIDRML